MTELDSELELSQFVSKNGVKLLYIYSPSCMACTIAADTINECRMTLELMVNHCSKIEISKCRDYCKKNDISGTPNMILFDDSGREISRLSFTPDLDDLMIWLNTTLD